MIEKEKDSLSYGFNGTRARLIPVIADSRQEERATSILLAAMQGVHEFRKVMLESLKVRVGTRSVLKAWTEITFPDEQGYKGRKSELGRPDGAIVLDTGRKQWKALIEAKTDNNVVSEKQLREYIDKAKTHGFNAVITITNQFAAQPDHHPVDLGKSIPKSVKLYHWSWTYALSQAALLLRRDGIEDEDQRFILNEVVRFFHDPKSGVKGLTQMNKQWEDVVHRCFNKSTLSRKSEEVLDTISTWHQELRELSLQLWAHVDEEVDVKLKRPHKKDPKKRVADDAAKLCDEHRLEATLDVPNAASDIEIVADLGRRAITCSMVLEAPKDKKRSTARVNWLARQFPENVLADQIYIKPLRRGRTQDIEQPLSLLLKHPEAIDEGGANGEVGSFEIFMVDDLGSKFGGSRVFIARIEAFVLSFYENVGQHLRAWVAPPPKVKPPSEGEPNEQKSTSKTSRR